jgi:hypothetical protein
METGLEFADFISSAGERPQALWKKAKRCPPGAIRGCGSAFRRAHGTLAPLIWQVRRMCLEGAISGPYDAS